MVGLEDENDNAADGSVCLNMINEFDVASRAEASYILCMVNLLRSRYGQAVLTLDPGPESELPLEHAEQRSSKQTESLTEEAYGTGEHDSLKQGNV